jgi:hypothetical protein
MRRTLEPEILDSLPPDHPDALHNRRDLRVINRVMGNHRWFHRTLPALIRPGEAVLEVGAGTGELGVRLAAAGIPVDGLDLWPRPAGWPVPGAWYNTDLRTFARYADYPVVIGNLIFHQFSADDLATLGAALRSRARVIAACEPLRRRQSQSLYALLAPLLGANYVSRHDGHVSIAAGFCEAELPALLGLEPAQWDCRCSITVRGAYRMVAIRRT